MNVTGASEQFQRLLAGYDVNCSMSRSGNDWDNWNLRVQDRRKRNQVCNVFRAGAMRKHGALEPECAVDKGPHLVWRCRGV